MWQEQLAGECGVENLEVDMGGMCELLFDQDGVVCGATP
jgi:hypothetical protein